MLLYHISDSQYSELKQFQLQPNGIDKLEELRKLGMSEDYLKEYIHEVNFFFEQPTLEQKNLMVKNGFKNWDTEDTFIHVVDTSTIKYNYITIASTPEERSYDLVHWNDFLKRTKHLTDKEYFVERDLYKKERDSYLEKYFGIKPKMTMEELEKHKLLSKWSDFKEHFLHNLRYGNKEQYQSFIPHVQISVNEPIKVKDIIKLK